MPRHSRKYWLLLASIVFYAYWDWRFLGHFIGVVLINYGFVKFLLKRRVKSIFILAISLNLLNLCFFKYVNSVLVMMGKWGGMPEALLLKKDLGIILPLAISFYTFQIIAFTTDVWRREVKEIDFIRYSFFIMFFPQLIAGPIMRHSDFLHQIDHTELKEEDVPAGLYLLLLGTIKKVLIADELARIINPVWAAPGQFDQLAVFAASIGFVAQVYCDFSGYTDMARGVARLLGYHIPENFFFPYLSTSFAELWKRWHVTLSTWLRDYLYIPLGGSRTEPARLYLNIIVVMSLGGLWHGNTYAFFLWGLLHGVFLALERFLGFSAPARTLYTAIPRNFLVMIVWWAGAVFFRGQNMETAIAIFSGLLENEGFSLDNATMVFQLTLMAWLLQFLQKYRGRYEHYLKQYWKFVLPALCLITFYLIVRIETPPEKFIYFQF